MSLIEKFGYRPEIDGLRAIAVLAVVLFHAGFGFSGGYVGVDIFFVISGYLITSIIWRDLESGSFSFPQFWERRARRIVPAIVVVTIAVLVAGWFILLPEDLRQLGQAASAQAVFAANIYYWLHTGYFAGVADQKVLLHTWSLAVEEQFYLIAPLMLWAMFRYTALQTRKAVISVLAAGFIASFALSVYMAATHPSVAFYFLPTRAWELLFGALIAFLPAIPVFLDRRILRESFSLMGLACILIPVFMYIARAPFPGFAACLGTALLIWANGRTDVRRDSSAPTTVGALLSLRPVVFIGLVSYSFYLWHWPFLAFSQYLAIAPLPWSYRVLMIVLGFLCAVLSWKFVETPFRKRKLGATRKAVFIYAGAGLAMVFAIGLSFSITNGYPQRLPAQAVRYADAVTDMSFINEMTVEDVRRGKLVRIGATDSTLTPSVLVWGDSHAMAALPAIDALLKEKDLAGCAATHSVTAPVLNWFLPPPYSLGKAFGDAVFAYIQNQRIPNVILIARWSDYSNGEKDSSFNSALLMTVRRLVAAGSRPWVLLDVPNQSFDVPRVLARSVISLTNTDMLCTKAPSQNTLDSKLLVAIKDAGGRVLDPKPLFLDPTGHRYIVQTHGYALYRDSHHLTTEGAKLILLPFLRYSLVLDKFR